MHRCIPLVIPHTMVTFPGPHSKVGTISTNFLFFPFGVLWWGAETARARTRGEQTLHDI